MGNRWTSRVSSLTGQGVDIKSRLQRRSVPQVTRLERTSDYLTGLAPGSCRGWWSEEVPMDGMFGKAANGREGGDGRG